MAGNSAHVISTFEEYGKKIVEKTKEYPWDEYDSGDILIKKKMDYLWKR